MGKISRIWFQNKLFLIWEKNSLSYKTAKCSLLKNYGSPFKLKLFIFFNNSYLWNEIKWKIYLLTGEIRTNKSSLPFNLTCEWTLYLNTCYNNYSNTETSFLRYNVISIKCITVFINTSCNFSCTTILDK